MNSALIDFFEDERKRTFTPRPFFTQRVMARGASDTVRPAERLEDTILASTRAVLVLALTLLFIVLAIQILYPVEPARGAIEAYLSEDLPLSEQLLIAAPRTSPTSAQLEELALWESGQ